MRTPLGSRRMHRVVIVALTMVLAVGGLVGVSATPALAATQICDEFGNAKVNGGRYIVQNNRWGTSSPQCTTARDGGFTVDRAEGSIATNGPPKSYPSIFAGCHYEVCSSNSGLPVKASAVGNARTSVSLKTAPGQWNASYDIWFDSERNPTGQNDGTEIMIWLNKTDKPQPIGSAQGKVTIAGTSWTVWQGNIGWNVISFVRDQPATSADLALKPFVDESVRRGATKAEWYMTSVQFGFEPWSNGAGLSASNFSFSTAGGGSAAGGSGSGGAGSGQAGILSDAKLIGTGSARCVDVNGASKANGSRVQLFDCNGSGAQTWKASGDKLINGGSGKCLDVRGASKQNGTGVQLWSCQDGNPAQQWKVNPNGTITNPNSGKCLDAKGAAKGNRTELIIFTCDAGKANQTWS